MRVAIALLAFLLAAPAAAQLQTNRASGDEDIDYARALTQYQFSDLAIEHLEQIAARPGLADARRQAIEFEVASSMIGLAQEMGDLSRRQTMLEQARRRFDDFSAKYPGSDQAATALTEVALIDLRQGVTHIIMAQLPSNADRSGALAGQARDYLRKAVASYDRAFKQLKAEYDAFPAYISEEENPEQHAKRSATFDHYIEARFQAALGKFYLADSYASVELPEPKEGATEEDRKRYRETRQEWSERYAASLKEALATFEAIQSEHRRELVGMVGELWAARCMAALDEHRKARGIFLRLSEHEDPRLRPFQRDVFYFRVLSLMATGEYAQVVANAELWLRENSDFRGERAYQGVALEYARALTELATGNEDASARAKQIREADQWLQQLASYNNEFTGLARRQQQRLLDLGGRDAGARTFFQYKSLGESKLDLVTPALSAAERVRLLGEARDDFLTALSLVKSGDAPEQVNEARLTLAYTLVEMGDVYQGVVLCEFVAREFPEDRVAPVCGLQGVQALAIGFDRAEKLQEQGKETTPQVDAEKLRELATYLASGWPRSKEADGARVTLGRLERYLGNYRAAIDAGDAVADGSDRQADALNLAGLAAYDWYRKLQADGAADAEVADKRQMAIDRLAQASERYSRTPPDASQFVNDAVLAALLYDAGADERVLQVVRPYVAALEENRVPEAVAADQRIGLLVTALQSHIRRGDLGADSDRLVSLIGSQRGSDDAGGVTRVFVDLAARIKEQIESLPETDRRRRELIASFEKFIDTVSGREAGQTIQTRVYIGRSLLELGNPTKAMGILEQAVRSPDAEEPANAAYLAAAQGQLAQAYVAAGSANKAFALANDLYAANPRDPAMIRLRGDVLKAVGNPQALKLAANHWKLIYKRFRLAKPGQPHADEYYLAVDQLAEIAGLSTGADGKTLSQQAAGLLNRVLRTDPAMPAEWRGKLAARQRTLVGG